MHPTICGGHVIFLHPTQAFELSMKPPALLVISLTVYTGVILIRQMSLSTVLPKTISDVLGT